MFQDNLFQINILLTNILKVLFLDTVLILIKVKLNVKITKSTKFHL